MAGQSPEGLAEYQGMGLTETDVQSPFLTLDEVAKLLRLSRRTVERRVKSGELPAVRCGRKGTSVRVDAAELEGWLYADDSGGFSSRSDPAERRAAAPAHRGAAARGDFR